MEKLLFGLYLSQFWFFTLVSQVEKSSTIIENIKAIANPQTGFTFFYFDINDKAKQNSRSLLSSLVLGLTARSRNYPLIQYLYEKHDKLYSPTEDELLDLLVKLLQGFNEAYIIIDALDECDEYHHLLDVINTIHNRQLSHFHLLVSSRMEQDILEAMKGCTTAELCLSAQLVRSDIISYVNDAVAKPRFRRWGNKAQEHIKEALVNGAHGMFRWVACQIEELMYCPNEAVLMDTLKSLPKDLEVIYDQILHRIHRSEMPSAKALLTWLVFGMCPLRLEELAVVVTLNPTNGTFDSSWALPHPDDIIQICSSLVMKTGHGTVELAHSSVKDYFLGQPRAWQKEVIGLCDPSAGHTLITHCCLRYLMQPEQHNEVPDDVSWEFLDTEHIFTHFPLLQYSVNFWPDHYELSSKDSALQSLAMILFDCDSTVCSKWVKLGDKTKQLHHRPPIAYAGFLGLKNIVQALMRDGWHSNYNKAIQSTAINGNISIIEMMLQMGADINYCSGYHGTALTTASKHGHYKLVKFLIDNGADVNHQCICHSSALYSACHTGYTEIVELLLYNGVDVKAPTTSGGLYSACFMGHTEVIKLLLEKGANVDAEQAINGLNAALEEGYAEIVTLILDKSANMNALYDACQRGDTEIVKLSLHNRADMNTQQTLNGLNVACEKGHTEIVKLLLVKGVKMNVQQALNGLKVACQQGYIEIAKLLLGKGLDVNVEPSSRELEAGFHVACEKGHIEIVKLLLDKGVKVKVQQALDGLKVACQQGYTELAKLLLDNLARLDVNVEQVLDDLEVACQKGHTEIVKHLLDKVKDENAKQALVFLNVACEHGHTEIFNFLLENKLSFAMHASSRELEAGFHVACEKGHIGIVKHYLNKTSSVVLALHAFYIACEKGHTEIVKHVLDMEIVDVNAWQVSEGLNNARRKGHIEIVQLFWE